MRGVILLAGVLVGAALIITGLLNGSSILDVAIPWMLWTLVYLGLGYALAFGLLAYLQHARLRRILHDRGHMAEDYVAFLNQTAERNLLRKVGGGYTYVHALLLQYFGERE